MAILSTPFLADDLPQGNIGVYEALPAGWYTATIAGCEMKQTKSGTGSYLAVRYDITGPTHQGRVIFSNLNITNANPKAEEIGRQQLRQLMEAIGLAKLADTDQLVNGNVKIKLKIEKSEEYGDKNQVSAFAKPEGGSSAPKPSAVAPAAKSSSAPPWAR
tara:strand:+ start:521 stop:1000 length:480 start_codon:yes stop_codon:yes gene_type:complete